MRLELDLTAYESSSDLPTRGLSGIEFATLAELGDSEEGRYRLFELNRECSADIPGRGPFHTWEQYRRRRLEVPGFDPDCVSLAVEGDEWVGMAALSVHPNPVNEEPHLFSEMTGVVRRWRRRGLATALKMHSIDVARSSGLRTIRTVHHPGNTAMISLNRRLGFIDAEWQYPS